jgi:hypothetical protein
MELGDPAVALGPEVVPALIPYSVNAALWSDVVEIEALSWPIPQLN